MVRDEDQDEEDRPGDQPEDHPATRFAGMGDPITTCTLADSSLGRLAEKSASAENEQAADDRDSQLN
jgi:hypothetical protein